MTTPTTAATSDPNAQEQQQQEQQHDTALPVPPNPPQLPLLGTTALASPVPTRGTLLLACNPAIDLTATAGDGGAALHVWRAGDQLVSKHVERGRRVEAVRWKADGRFQSFNFFFCLL
jgi:hypothetical protein